MPSPAFEFVAGEIERRGALAKLEARGTVRLALKRSGLDAGSVSSSQMIVVLERVLPQEIRSRGVAGSEDLCRAIATALGVSHPEAAISAESPEVIFRRLAGGG